MNLSQPDSQRAQSTDVSFKIPQSSLSLSNNTETLEKTHKPKYGREHKLKFASIKNLNQIRHIPKVSQN